MFEPFKKLSVALQENKERAESLLKKTDKCLSSCVYTLPEPVKKDRVVPTNHQSHARPA